MKRVISRCNQQASEVRSGARQFKRQLLVKQIHCVENIYKSRAHFTAMASYPPGPQKMKIDYNIDRKIYDEFARMCSRKGFAPQIIIEKLMKKFTETGQA